MAAKPLPQPALVALWSAPGILDRF
jgi:hypothetical protein